MSNTPIFIDISAWVESNKDNDLKYRQSQAIHIFLATIARLHPQYTMYLKGGLLMGLVYNSPRRTTDVDLTAGFKPQVDIGCKIKDRINLILPGVIATLGYIGSRLEIEKVRTFPKKIDNPLMNAKFPALKFDLLFISRLNGPHDRIAIDISFNELAPRKIDVFNIGDNAEIQTYGLVEIIAEKYRDLLQQPLRKRNRRQDIFDLDYLIQRFNFTKKEMEEILETIIRKCKQHEIEPKTTSIEDPEVRERAGRDWDSIQLEVGNLPDFTECFKVVNNFYKILPWEGNKSSTQEQ